MFGPPLEKTPGTTLTDRGHEKVLGCLFISEEHFRILPIVLYVFCMCSLLVLLEPSLDLLKCQVSVKRRESNITGYKCHFVNIHMKCYVRVATKPFFEGTLCLGLGTRRKC